MIARAYRRVKYAAEACVWWMECHPRTGWYIAVMVSVNVVLNLLSLFQ